MKFAIVLLTAPIVFVACSSSSAPDAQSGGASGSSGSSGSPNGGTDGGGAADSKSTPVSSAPVGGRLGGGAFTPKGTTILGSSPTLLLLFGDATVCNKSTNKNEIFFQMDLKDLQKVGVYDNVGTTFGPDPLHQTGTQSGHVEVITPIDPNAPSSSGVFRVRARVDDANYIEGQLSAQVCH